MSYICHGKFASHEIEVTGRGRRRVDEVPDRKCILQMLRRLRENLGQFMTNSCVAVAVAHLQATSTDPSVVDVFVLLLWL